MYMKLPPSRNRWATGDFIDDKVRTQQEINEAHGGSMEC